jgi:hypothetical protein
MVVRGEPAATALIAASQRQRPNIFIFSIFNYILV